MPETLVPVNTVTTFTPPGLPEQYQKEFKFFMDCMSLKLKKNAHKGKWEDLDLDTTLGKLRGEVDELAEAIRCGNSIETILEAADIAVYAMIVAHIATKGVASE